MAFERTSLTQRQQEIYDFIKDKIMNRGYGPTVREIGAAFEIRSPNGVMCHLKALERKGLITREQGMSRAIQLTDAPQLKRASLPMCGQIAAGAPILAIEQAERMDFGPLFQDSDHFCLKVRGESMIEAHIADGDYAVIRKQSHARDGEIVAALIDGSDATLKKLYREDNRVRLEPCNSTMQPIYSQHVDVIGVMVGLIRNY
jgi:repressor LexA